MQHHWQVPAADLKPINRTHNLGRVQAMQMAVADVNPAQAAVAIGSRRNNLSCISSCKTGLAEWLLERKELSELDADFITGQQEAAARRSDLMDQMGKAAELAEKREKQQQAFARQSGNNIPVAAQP